MSDPDRIGFHDDKPENEAAACTQCGAMGFTKAPDERSCAFCNDEVMDREWGYINGGPRA